MFGRMADSAKLASLVGQTCLLRIRRLAMMHMLVSVSAAAFAPLGSGRVAPLGAGHRLGAPASSGVTKGEVHAACCDYV